MVALLLLGSSGQSWAESPVERGRKIAMTHCSRCHVVNPANKFGGIDSTPSFQLLAGLPDGLARFDTFISRRPHPAFMRVEGVKPLTDLPPNAAEIKFVVEDLEAVAAFARTIKK